MGKCKPIIIIIFALVGAQLVHGAGKWPWPRRKDSHVETLHFSAHKNTPPSLWPVEPAPPRTIDPEQFSRALGELCSDVSAKRIRRYSALILKESHRFHIDPFILGALIYDQSRCWPATPKRDQKVEHYGLTRLPLAMHKAQVRKGTYTYYTGSIGNWQTHQLDINQYPFNRWKAAKPESNIYFSAAILHILKEQHTSLDLAFDNVPHRHYISHWFWGDRVKNPEPENRVLTARRRLISYYSQDGLTVAGTFDRIHLVSPLDGAPRLSLDYFGNKRGKKDGYGHRGIDIDGAQGEPIRAVADGRITFAGVDLHGKRAHQLLSPEEAAKLTNDQMGPGGLYVVINHGNDFGTIYMHLASYQVNYNEQVKAGQIIGTMGRSGTQTPGPHLHLEFREEEHRVDPAHYIADVLVDPFKK